MNQAELKRLREAIDADALGLGWPAMDDAAVAESMNAQSVKSRRAVPLAELYRLAIESGFLLAVESAASAHAVAEVQQAAKLAVHYITNPRFDHLDLDLVATETVLDALLQGGVLTAEQKAAIDALADVTVPYVKTLGLTGPILPGHITKARAL